MKLMWVPARVNVDFKPLLKKIKIKEKGKIGLVAALQHVAQLPEIQKHIPNSIIAGQILGCNFEKALSIKDKIVAYLYIGSGPFHPIGLAYEAKIPVYVANPSTNEFSKIDEKEVQAFEKRKRGLILKYLHSKKVGLIVSVKPHQQKWNECFRWQKIIEDRGKEAFLFITNTLDKGSLENFSDIEVWVNTACPRIEDESMINIREVIELPKQK